MAILSFTGWELGQPGTEFPGTTAGSAVAASATHVRTGSWALRINPSAAAANYSSITTTAAGGSYCAAYFYVASLPSGNGSIIFDWGNGASSLHVTCDTNGD